MDSYIYYIDWFNNRCILFGDGKNLCEKYNDFIAKLNKGDVNEFEVYDMKPRNTDLKNELLAMTITSMTSFSVYGFYSLFIIISILIKFV